MPLSQAQPRTHLHTRSIVIDGYERDDGLHDIEARLTDTKSAEIVNEDRGTIPPGEPLHGMFMRLTIDAERLIVACEAATDHAPYAICPSAAANFSRLAGIRIRPGFLREALARVSGTQGCTHLRELLQQMGTVAYQTLYSQSARAKSGLTDDSRSLLGTCLAYGPDSPVVRRRWPDAYTGPCSAMRRTGNTVLITGGASGIGLALARLLLEAGNIVVVCGRDQARLDAACAELPGLIAVQADVADAAARETLAADIAARFPALNVLVNNAGLLHVSDLTAATHVAELEAEIATNLVAPVALISLLLPVLRRQVAATIVNVTTGYVFLPSARTAPYSATKAALRVMTRTLRFQLRGTAIRVVEVMPPAVDTAMAGHYAGAKLAPEVVARRIVDGLAANRDEIVIGVSRWAKLMARAAPALAFTLMNRGEARS